MRVATAHSTERDSSQAAREAYASVVEALGGAPDWLFVQSTVAHPGEALQRALSELGPRAVHGSSSCAVVMTDAGLHGGLALFGVRDPGGAYGVGSAALGEDPRDAARRAVLAAMDAAGRPGEVPMLVWMTAAPGHEEACIAGIEAILGPDVPVVGGSAADDTITGQWYQLTRTEAHAAAVVVSALYPSGRVASSFQSGYTPTAIGGRVTRAHERTILEIDGAPAATVYDRWTGGAIAGALGGGNVLADSTLFPLGRRVGGIGEVAYYRLAHPAVVGKDGALELFARFDAGDELVLMQGTFEALVTRAGRVAADALELAGVGPQEVAGALVVLCAGCMLAVRERLEEVAAGVRAVLGATPFVGCLTFGEQGCFAGGENRHANLMISVTLLVHSRE
ncbi:FIST N-terminal domain-containing protein [Nannocystis sp. SCPEA4]|uniref:FIST signal transduction protein n=1 Tax=Nannocystis sp. SCPEA4 TaxID=2996787 RepID=UPI00226D637E|nr:FIST N-terminal domain-containing protein [Nannocystis sp. SCPEA4]MCY1061766.1 FIST C-terminal domain-containing protein [Nannocystis sp. SCPEA4]